MGHTMIDLRQQYPYLDQASGALGEASLADSLEQAYEARTRAVLHGTARAQARTARVVAHLERLCLEERQLHRLTAVADVDPSYYLG